MAEESSEVKVPEEFQVKVAELMKGINKEQCDFIQDACQNCMSEFYKKENKESFSDTDMPKE